MAETALGALYRAVRERLVSASEQWGTRVGLSFLQASGGERIGYPYVVYTIAGGGMVYDVSRNNGYEYRLDVMAVADSFALAEHCAGRISELFEGQGTQQMLVGQISPFENGGNWEIVSIQQDATISFDENDQGRHTWICGHTYRFKLYPQ